MLFSLPILLLSLRKVKRINSDNNELLEVVYSEGSNIIDPYKLIVDSACPKTVTGRAWMDAYLESKGDIFIKRYKENENFKFGPSRVYKSSECYEIEVKIGKLKDKVKVSVVDADIPLLLGLDYQEKWGVVIDIARKELKIRKTNEIFQIEPNCTHWTLPIQGNKSLIKQTNSLVFSVVLDNLSRKDLRKHLIKVHKNLSHKSEQQMLKLFKMAGKDSKLVKEVLKDVVDTCTVCRRFKKTPPRPRIALAKANTVNEVVSVDLKEKGSKYILYICDEFSGFMVAEVINNKLPDTVLEAFNRKWVMEGPGIPIRGIFADNGGEFKNPEMKEAASKYNISLSLTAARSPWSNGKNEREHFTCDMTIDKLMEEDHKIKLEDAVRLAVYAKNMQINGTGFRPRQLMYGRQGIIPGISDGNPASLEPVVESDRFRNDLINRQRAEELFRKFDSNERIKKLLTQRTYGYGDQKFSEGELILFKEEGKNRWSGPAKVTGTEGNKVRIIHSGYDRTVPICRVIPYEDTAEIVDEENTRDQISDKFDESTVASDEEVSLSEEEFQQDNANTLKDLRPKLHKEVKFMVLGENNWRLGKVFRVGKKSGKDKFRVWIVNEDNIVNSYDFVNDIISWKYRHIEFDDSANGEFKSTARSENLTMGVWLLQNQDAMTNDENGANDVYAVEIPKRFHEYPEVKAAKEAELQKWQQYGAYEEVLKDDQDVISMRWVVTEKDEGQVKARLVVRGFEEREAPQSDSPTASKDSCKLFLALCANEGFKLKTLDVTSAFLQGQPLSREVFVQPPEEMRKEGVIWKLKKTCYGLYDASRSWYFAVKEQIENLGMKTLSGDSSFFYLLKEGKLLGLCILHVDDFLVGGTSEFFDLIENNLLNKFTFGKVQCNKFKYTGINIEQKENGEIFIDQDDYIQSLKEIEIDKPTDKNEKLSRRMFKEYRALTGQLTWAAEMTRPDLCFDARELSTRNKDATYGDVKRANKILKKAQMKRVSVKFSKLGKLEDLRIVAFTDSSYRNDP